jgi:hypothetical protein
MDPAVETLARSPKLPRLVNELQGLLREEAKRRKQVPLRVEAVQSCLA